MKKKSVFLSKVFAVALAASLAFSTPYVSAETVSTSKTYEGAGSKVSTLDSGWWQSWSEDYYRLTGDFDVTFEFTNKSDGLLLYCNYLMVFTNASDAHGIADNPEYVEYVVIRADNWGWSVGGDGGDLKTLDGNPVTFDYSWADDQFIDMIKDSKITSNITRKGNDFVINDTIVGANGQTGTRKTTFTVAADNEMNIFLTGQSADVNIISYTVNSTDTQTPTTPETPSDTVTPPAIDVDPGENTAPVPETPTTPTPEDPATPADPTPETPSDTDTTPEEPSENEPATTTKKAAKLNQKTLSIKVGQSKTLKVKNTTKKVKWSSSNKKVAKVKAGKVTGVKAGKATIKAKVGNKTLKCTVTVK